MTGWSVRVCVAECLTNDIARRVGLPVVDTEFLRAGADGGVPFLRIERCDRARDADGRLRRLHQEDLLQALGRSAAIKYQRDGGPSLGDAAELLREHAARPVEALARLRDWQIFNCLVGNWDGHAKNLALRQPASSLLTRSVVAVAGRWNRFASADFPVRNDCPAPGRRRRGWYD